MVTAIVIPIICIYFYFITKKELRESHQKWIQLKNVPEEAMITGRISNVNVSKQRFSYHRFVYVIDIKIQADHSRWDVKKMIPIDGNVQLPQLHQGENVRVYGNWKEDFFLVSRIEFIN